MPDYGIKFENLTQQEINQVWTFLQNSALRAVLQHVFDKKIREARAGYDSCTKEEFEGQRRYIDGLKDQAGHIKNTKPPQKQ